MRSITAGLSIICRLVDVKVGFGLGLRSRRSYLGSMEVHDFQPALVLVSTIVRRSRNPACRPDGMSQSQVAEHLKLHILTNLQRS